MPVPMQTSTVNAPARPTHPIARTSPPALQIIQPKPAQQPLLPLHPQPKVEGQLQEQQPPHPHPQSKMQPHLEDMASSSANPSSSSAMQTPPFLTKLYQLVSDPDTAELVSWTDGRGTSFTVHKPSDFGRDVLPKYFKHNNFSSFVRQLNQYGFHKQNPDRWMFGHDAFRQDRPDLLRNITRRRPKPAPPTVVSNVMVAPHALTQNRAVVELGNYGLEGEVKGLQRDKDLLIKELVVTRQAEEKLKNKCDSLETRMQSLEVTTKQMQGFIMHYFSQVLQPYSNAMVSRKRKRLPASEGAAMGMDAAAMAGGSDSMDIVARTDTGAGADVAQAAAGGSPVDALRVLMEQMGVMSRNPAAAAAAAAGAGKGSEDRPRITFDPATVQELPEAAVDEGANGYSGVRSQALVAMTGTGQQGMAQQGMAQQGMAQQGIGQQGIGQQDIGQQDIGTGVETEAGKPNGTLAIRRWNSGTHGSFDGIDGDDLSLLGSTGVPSGSERNANVSEGNEITLDFLDDIPPSPGSSFTMDMIENVLKEQNGDAHHSIAIPAGGTDGVDGVEGMSCIPAVTSAMPSPAASAAAAAANAAANAAVSLSPLGARGKLGGGERAGDDDAVRDLEQRRQEEEEEESDDIAELLDLDEDDLPPPLKHLPEGTDIVALAQRIEGFANGRMGT